MTQSSDNRTERLAKATAELINGGDWNDKAFYTEEQRDLWRGHAAKLDVIYSMPSGRPGWDDEP